MTIYYDIAADNRFLVYIVSSSTLFIFQNDRLAKRLDIRPQLAMDFYRSTIESALANKSSGKEWYNTLFSHFFVDKDNGGYFYLDGGNNKHNNKKVLYKFDLEGKLITVYRTIESVIFLEKRNDLFYALSNQGLVVFKEK